MFTAEIIEDPVWGFTNKKVSVSATVTIKAGEVIIDTRPISISVSIDTENWKEKGYAALIEKAKSEFGLYQTYYQKVMTDTGFATPDEVIADIKSKLNTALAEV